MLDKVFYFNVGSREVRVAFPTRPLSKFLFVLFACLCVLDLFTGNLLGAFLMFVFAAIHVVDVE